MILQMTKNIYSNFLINSKLTFSKQHLEKNDEIIEKYKTTQVFKQLKILFIQENYLIYRKLILKTIKSHQILKNQKRHRT